MINQQENVGLSDSHHRHECEIYDDLSSLMQIFKKLLLAVEEISLLHPRAAPQVSPQQRLRGLSKSLQTLVRKYSEQSGELRIEQRTFQRFVCRLFETLELCQLKLRNHEGGLAASRLAAIESALKEGDCLHDFLRLIRTIRLIVERTACLEQPGQALEASPQQSPQARKVALDRMEAKMIKLRNVNRVKVERREEKGQSDQDDDYDEVRSVSFTEKKPTSLPFAQSISSDLQKRFELYKGLQLDFSNFKSSYFSAKTNPEQFYQQYLQRNILSSKIIKGYSDDFFLFQKKRLKNHRRIALNKPQQQEGKELDLTPKLNQSENFTKSEHLSRKEERGKRVAVIHNQEGQDDRDDRLKTSYKMNSIYLTFGKKPQRAARQHPNITPNMLKNRLEPHSPYLNQSLCHKNDLSITQSIDFEQLKVVSGVKGNNRIKTQPDRDKAAFQQSQKARGQYRQALMRAFRQADHMPFRAVSKRRYLELDCTSKQEISLNKVILTGNLHARHIKLGKLQSKDSAILF